MVFEHLKHPALVTTFGDILAPVSQCVLAACSEPKLNLNPTVDVVYDSRRSLVQFPAAATNTGMGDGLRVGKPPQYYTKLPRPTQPPTLSGTEDECQSQSASTLCG